METYQVVSLLVVGGAFIGVTIFGVITSRKWWGKRAYQKLFPSELVYTVLYAVPIWIILRLFSMLQVNLTTIMLAGSLFFVASLIWPLIRRSQPTSVLLNLGRLNLEFAKALGIILVMTAALSVGLAFLDKRDLVTTTIVAGLYLVCGGAYLYYMSRKQATITPVGFDTGQRVIRWEKIESYEWDRHGAKMDTLLLRLRKSMPFSKTTAIRVPARQYEAVNGLLSEYASKS